MSDLVMRHDIPNIGNMSEAYPHLIFHNFKSRLGERVSKHSAYKKYHDYFIAVLKFETDLSRNFTFLHKLSLVAGNVNFEISISCSKRR